MHMTRDSLHPHSCIGAALVEFVLVKGPSDDHMEHFRCAGCGQFGNLKSLKLKTVSHDNCSNETWIPPELLVAESHACVYPKGTVLSNCGNE